MKVQKYLAEKGICSRREAESLLKAGLIKVNGERAIPGVPLNSDDVVTIDPVAEKKLADKITVAIYKPRGIMCSRSKEEGKNVFDIWPRWKHLNTVGRLDKESEGLLLLSNDGLITKKVTGDTHEIEKEYEIKVREDVFAGKLKPMIDGMMLADGPTLPAQVEVVDKHTFRIILHEGRNRQIRRMCGQLDLEVVLLKRIRIGSVKIGNLQPGEAREITKEEIAGLKELV